MKISERERYRTPRQLEQQLPRLVHLPGWRAYAYGDLQNALSVVRSRLRHSDEDGRIWELAGLIERDLGKPLSAADAFEKAALLVPLHPLSQIYLAESYAVLRRRQLAKELYQEIAHANDRDANLLLLIAAGLEAIDEPHLAMQICRRADAVEPDCGQTLYDMSRYAARCGASPTLLESLGWRAVELEPENVHFRVGLASLLIRLDKETHAYFLVKRFSADQLREITCVCCLQRIRLLYARHGDKLRSTLVQAQVEQLTEAGSQERLRFPRVEE